MIFFLSSFAFGRKRILPFRIVKGGKRCSEVLLFVRFDGLHFIPPMI